MLRVEMDASCDTLQASKTEFSNVQVDWEILTEQGHNMMNLLVELRTWIETLQLCVQAAQNAGFAMDDLFAEEPLQALPTHLIDVVTEAIH
jgi:hypothetical protein